MKNLSQISVILMKHLSHFGHLRLAGMLVSHTDAAYSRVGFSSDR